MFYNILDFFKVRLTFCIIKSCLQKYFQHYCMVGETESAESEGAKNHQKNSGHGRLRRTYQSPIITDFVWNKDPDFANTKWEKLVEFVILK